MKIAALIIGIDGWEKYTQPLIESIKKYEPDCRIIVIDNASKEPYPIADYVWPTERLCYSAAINVAAKMATHGFDTKPDWYIVLSNDVLCVGPFASMLASMPNIWVAGPHLMKNQGWTYLEGWCVCVPAAVWEDIGGWDENFQVSSWEDVDFSTTALEKGYNWRIVQICHLSTWISGNGSPLSLSIGKAKFIISGISVRSIRGGNNE